jgi:4-amino-4-deoxychorismate lyase
MSTLREILLDGQPNAAPWLQDRGLHYGDGLFETVLVRAGQLRFEALHRARLARGCRQLAITVDDVALWQQARELARKHGAALLKILVTRGSATSRGYAPSGTESARCIVYVYDAPQAAEIPAQPAVISLPNFLGENPRLAGLKHCNRLEQILARQEVLRQGAFEGLLGSSSGLLISGTMSNVFLEQGDTLLTPVLDRCGIAGVMRQVVLREAPRLGFKVRVTDIPFQLTQTCNSIFVTNIRLGVFPLHSAQGRTLTSSQRIAQLIAQVATLEH